MAKREFLQLAHVFNPEKHRIGAWFMSEKLDGMRAFWDGGITRGLFADEVPWANVEKDGRLVNRPISTGLWSRYGKVIHAPKEWLDTMPPLFLDGELHIPIGLYGKGVSSFQKLMTVAKKLDATLADGWGNIDFRVLDMPPIHAVFANGEINNTNFKKKFAGVESWARSRHAMISEPSTWHFHAVQEWLEKFLPQSSCSVILHKQEQLPYQNERAQARMMDELGRVVAAGGEGLILRNPTTFWVPQRSHSVLKVKPSLDAEAKVVGYVWGRETDLGSKLLGLMGALVVEYNGKEFELSGFTDQEREMNWAFKYDAHDEYFSVQECGALYQGKRSDDRFENPKFPIGSTVTFKYRELTNDGIPKEARYWRGAD